MRQLTLDAVSVPNISSVRLLKGIVCSAAVAILISRLWIVSDLPLPHATVRRPSKRTRHGLAAISLKLLEKYASGAIACARNGNDNA